MIDSGHCDGPETLMRLREIDNFNIPVIVLTVSKGKRDMFVNGYGFNEYMEKLLTQDKVMETLPKLFKDLEFTKIESNKSAWSEPKMLDKKFNKEGSFFMSKYSKEFKLEVVKYYLQEHHSYSECCKKFNIPSMTPIKQWVDKYQLYGV